MSRPLWPYSLALCLAFALRVASQTSNVTTCVADYVWSLNSNGQTPCLIAAYLETLCGVPTSVDAIPVGTHYLGPAIGQSTVCLCSSVTYSAVSACGGCQGRTFQNWTTWSGNCASAEVSSFPKIIPTEVVVPGWMYVNITLIGNNFDPKVAQQVLNGAPSPSLTTTTSIPSTTSSSTASSSTLTSATAIPAQQGASKKSNAGAIAGGTIAGLVVLAVIGLYILWRVMQKRRNAVQKDLSFDSSALVAPSGGMYQQFTGSTGITQAMSMSHSTSPSGPSPTPNPYGNPSIYDARTSEQGHSAYPLSPVTSSGIYTSPGPARRSLESVSPSLVQLGGYQNPSQPRGYRGAAELS